MSPSPTATDASTSPGDGSRDGGHDAPPREPATPRDETTKYDCFISYRRSDGARLAGWLRAHLQSYRLPRAVSSEYARKLTVYLDTIYERPSDDFFERDIAPALKASRFLIVVATPDACRKRPDGSPSWVEREIATFLGTSQRSNIIAVQGGVNWDDPLPGDLQAVFPNLDIIDARDASTGVLRRILERLITPPAISTLVAPLFGIPQERMPELRQEESRRTRARVVAAAGLATAVFVTVAALGAYGWHQKVATDAANQTIVARYLAWQSGTVTKRAAQRLDEALLLAIEGYRRDASALTSSALRERLDATPLPIARFQHGPRINHIRFSPTGEDLATASDDGTVRVWGALDGRMKAEMARDVPASRIAFGPDGRELSVVFVRPSARGRRKETKADDHGRLVVWRWQEQAVTLEAEPPEPVRSLFVDPTSHGPVAVTLRGLWFAGTRPRASLAAFASPIRVPVARSDDSRLLAAPSDGGVGVFDATSGARLARLDIGGKARVTGLAFSPDNARIVVGRTDGTSELWNWRAGTKMFRHDGHSDFGPSTIVFSPDGEYVAEIYDAFILKIWLAENGKDVFTVDGNETGSGEFVPFLRFSHDSRYLIAQVGRSLRWIDLVDPDEVKTVLHFATGSVSRSLDLHPGGAYLAAGDADGWVTVWRLDGGKAVAHFGDAGLVETNPSDSSLAMGGKAIRITDRDFAVVAQHSGNAEGLRVIRYSASGDLLAAGWEDGKVAVMRRRHGTPVGWDLAFERASTAPGKSSDDAPGAVVELGFRKDERALIVVRANGISDVDLASGRETTRLAIPISPETVVSPDRRLLATKRDGGIHVVSLESFTETWTIPSKAFDPFMTLSPDGRFLAARPDDQQFVVWNVATRKPALTTKVAASTSQAAFDKTSQFFAVTDGETVQLWDIKRQKRVDLVQRLTEAGTVAFHPTEPYLAVGYEDQTIRIWTRSLDPRVIAEIPQEDPFTFGSRPIQFTPDGRFLIVAQGFKDGPYGKFVRLVAWRQDDVVREACRRALQKKLAATTWDEFLRGQPFRVTCPE